MRNFSGCSTVIPRPCNYVINTSNRLQCTKVDYYGSKYLKNSWNNTYYLCIKSKKCMKYFFQSFVAFSEYMNFLPKYILTLVWNSSSDYRSWHSKKAFEQNPSQVWKISQSWIHRLVDIWRMVWTNVSFSKAIWTRPNCW